MMIRPRHFFLLLALFAAPATAQSSWNCVVREDQGGVRATLTQTYWNQDDPLAQPVQEVSAVVDGVFFSASSYPRWSALDMPFELPRRIIVAVPVSERAVSRQVTLYAPGAPPMTFRSRATGWSTGRHEVSFEPHDPARIQALLTIPDWTAIVRRPDGRVQHIVPFRMAMTLERLRALRDSQVARLREMAHDPGRHCDRIPDEASIMSR